jgi:Beta-lactamase enzyme family
VLDWEAWRARTGGVDGRTAAEDAAPSADSSTPAPESSTPPPEHAGDELADHEAEAADRHESGRTGVAVVAIVAVGALLGGFAAFAVALGGPPTSPAPAASIAPGDVTGTLAPGGTGVGPHHAGGGSGHRDTPQGRPDPSLSPISEPTGQPTAGAAAATTADAHADPFSAAVTGYLTGRAGTVSAAIYDVTTGQTWTLGTGSPQATGSLVKVDILQALLADRPSGLPAADRARARSMIENNNNAPATTLWNQVGQAAGLRTYNASVGLQQTTPSACLVCAGFAWPGWGLTTTTPADQLLLLRALINGPPLSPAGRGYVLSLMENVEPDQRWGVSAGVPPGVRVALKSAWVPLTPADTDWQINSEGWISGDGRDYLVAILTTGNPDEQYGIATINTVSALLWAAMG